MTESPVERIDIVEEIPPHPDAELSTLRHELIDTTEPLPEDVLAERFRDYKVAEAELQQRAAEGLPPAEEEARS